MTTFSIPAEIIPDCVFGANLVIVTGDMTTCADDGKFGIIITQSRFSTVIPNALYGWTLVRYLSRLPWIFPGAPWKINMGLPEIIFKVI